MRLRPILSLLVPCLLAVGLGAVAPRALPIKPGYWESTNDVSGPQSSHKVERRCVTRAQVLAFMSGPSNSHYACDYPTRDIGGGQIALKGLCKDKHGQKLQVSGQGTYTPESFHIDSKVNGKLGAFKLSAKATTDAYRLADACPADAEH